MDATNWDLYREIHKGMRFGLSRAMTMAGSTDADDSLALQALRDEWRDVAFVLRGHHEHEDRFCDALIASYAPELREKLELQHHEADHALASLDAAAAQLVDATPAALRAFYLDLADFTARYFAHLRFEEDVVMPALNRALSNAELEQVTHQIRGSVPPHEMCVFIKYMAPGMSFAERLDMLGGMYRFAPKEIFELFRGAAEKALPAHEYAAVAQKAGFG